MSCTPIPTVSDDRYLFDEYRTQIGIMVPS
jgi:hypothetical protein